MNESTKAIAANFFQCAEHEVEDKLAALRQMLGGSPAPAAPTGPSQQDFDTLKASLDGLEKRVEAAEATLKDLTTPDIPDAPDTGASGSGTPAQS